jgi:uridine phosphorylase
MSDKMPLGEGKAGFAGKQYHIALAPGDVGGYAILPGDLVVAAAAIRAEGTSAEYLPIAALRLLMGGG